MSFFKMETRP